MRYDSYEAECKRVARRVAKLIGGWNTFYMNKMELIDTANENGHPVYVKFRYENTVYRAWEYPDKRGDAFRCFREDATEFKDNMEG